jgi:serine/threonine-protein kinase
MGRNGGAVQLDGVNDFVELGNPTALQLTGSMTVSAWVNSAAFPGDDAVSIISQHLHADPVPPSRRSELDIPADLDSVILACLAKHPDDRPSSAAELSRRLATAVNGEAWSEERAHRWWDRHHPEAGKPEPTSEFRQLTKTIDIGWEPESAPETQMDSARSL